MNGGAVVKRCTDPGAVFAARPAGQKDGLHMFAEIGSLLLLSVSSCA